MISSRQVCDGGGIGFRTLLCAVSVVILVWESSNLLARDYAKSLESRELIAALELQSSSRRLSPGDVQYLADAVRKALSDAIDPEKYAVMTRENMDLIIPPEERKCLNEACYAIVGKRLQARYVVAGSVKDIGKLIGVTLEAYEGPTGTLLGVEQGEAQDIDDLLKVVRLMASKLVGRVLKTTSGWQTGGGAVHLARGRRQLHTLMWST